MISVKIWVRISFYRSRCPQLARFSRIHSPLFLPPKPHFVVGETMKSRSSRLLSNPRSRSSEISYVSISKQFRNQKHMVFFQIMDLLWGQISTYTSSMFSDSEFGLEVCGEIMSWIRVWVGLRVQISTRSSNLSTSRAIFVAILTRLIARAVRVRKPLRSV